MTIRNLIALTNKFKKSYQRGSVGEDIARLLLTNNGYKVRKPKKNFMGDLQATDKATGQLSRIEVKVSVKGKYGYNWQLHKDDKYGKTSHTNADYILLLAIDSVNNLFAYLVPVAKVSSIKKIRIASHPMKYNGKYNQYSLNIRNFSIV